MNAVDIITIIAIIVALVFAIRAIRNGKTGECSGDCVNCSKNRGCPDRGKNADLTIKIKKASNIDKEDRNNR